jgi:outer membrane protein assembly factor BamA
LAILTNVIKLIYFLSQPGFVRVCRFSVLMLTGPLTAQVADSTARPPVPVVAVLPEQDVIDVAHALLPRWKRIVPHQEATLTEGGKFVWVIPQLGYTLQTSALAQVLVNVAFRRPAANVSLVVGTLTYTLNKQAILSFTSQVWGKKNRLLWIGDWRLMYYPQTTYGLGVINSSLDRNIRMDYQYLRVYQSVLTRIRPNLYGGVGYALDLHWDIRSQNETGEVTSISTYNDGIRGRSVSSGAVLRMLYDNRANFINATQGFYASLQYQASLPVLGSDRAYGSVLVECKKFLRPSAHSANVLAFWSYNSLILSGNAPYLDLPSTGWDTYGNMGRGFIQGRFRGKNLLYVETEYRFGLTRNRLLGGVVFANAQSVTEIGSGQFRRVVPAAGAGLRLNMNKISRTNLCIDYAFGADGSQGLFFNLGEVF